MTLLSELQHDSLFSICFRCLFVCDLCLLADTCLNGVHLAKSLYNLVHIKAQPSGSILRETAYVTVGA
jgi:hypothetical protein